MNQILKILAYGLGGLMLLVGSFATYSILSGTPPNDLKAVGGLFPGDVTSEEVERPEAAADPDAELERESDTRSPRQVLEEAATPLQLFTLPNPFSAEELRALERRLQTKFQELEERERMLEAYAAELDQERDHIADLFTSFTDLKTALLEQEAENQAVGAENERDRRINQEARLESFRQMAPLFADTKADEAARLMVSTYRPDEAALVLIELDEGRISELVGAISKLYPDDGPTYMRALQDERERRIEASE